MEVDQMIKILKDQIKMRQEIIDKLEKNRNQYWDCGLTTGQLEHLVDWSHWERG